jgi:predicted kinase
MPNMICLAGMPGVGKTTWAKKFLENHPDYVYFNPDQYYAFFNGDDTVRDNTFEVWMSMFRDINTAMKAGKNVIIDSDNLTFHQRTQWIEWFPDFQHILVFFEASWDTCYNQMKQRRRQLSYSTMLTKWEKWERPTVERDGKFWTHIYRGRHTERN